MNLPSLKVDLAVIEHNLVGDGLLEAYRRVENYAQEMVVGGFVPPSTINFI